MVSQRVIEANLEKIKVIIEIKLPSSVKVVQRLIGKIATLNLFMFKEVEKCLPFFKLRRKINNFEWIKECQ